MVYILSFLAVNSLSRLLAHWIVQEHFVLDTTTVIFSYIFYSVTVLFCWCAIAISWVRGRMKRIECEYRVIIQFVPFNSHNNEWHFVSFLILYLILILLPSQIHESIMLTWFAGSISFLLNHWCHRLNVNG